MYIILFIYKLYVMFDANLAAFHPGQLSDVMSVAFWPEVTENYMGLSTSQVLFVFCYTSPCRVL